MQSRRRRGAGLVAIVASVILLGGCTIAKTGKVAADAPDIVSVDPDVTGGATTVALNASTLAALTSQGISLHPSGATTVSGTSVSFPITSGYLEVNSKQDVKPGWIQGSLDHATSGLTVSDGSTTVHLDDFIVDPGNSVLYARVDGKVGVPLLALDGSHVTASLNDAGQIVLSGTVASLTATAAQALDTAFATPAITAGTPFGTVQIQAASGAPLPQGAQNNVAVASGSPSAEALDDGVGLTGASYNASVDHVTSISRLTGQSTTLTLEPAVAAALTSDGLKVGTTGSATSSGAAVTFPITAGFVAIHSNKGFQPGYVVGVVYHQGSGLTITAPGGASISLHDFVVNPGTSQLTGTVGDGLPGTPLFFLDGSKLQITPTANGATLDGTVAELTNQAAQALNSTFGVTSFKGGMPIGTVHLVATGS